jgi:hypothetical protein
MGTSSELEINTLNIKKKGMIDDGILLPSIYEKTCLQPC